MKSEFIEILFFRHGETDWNLERRLQGQTETRLNYKGKIQSKLLAENLSQNPPEIIFSSDSLRAKETSEIVARKLGIEIIYLPCLREIHLGQAQSVLENEISEKFGENDYKRWKLEDLQEDDFRFPEGESKREASERIETCLEQILETATWNRIGICSHGFVLSKLFSRIDPSKAAPKKLDNCEIKCILVPKIGFRKHSG